MISDKPLVLGMLDSTAFTVYTFTSVEFVMPMVVQSVKLVCQCVYFVYQMIIYEVKGWGGTTSSQKKIILMALVEFYRSGVTNLKIASHTFLLICVMSTVVILLCLLEFYLLL